MLSVLAVLCSAVVLVSLVGTIREAIRSDGPMPLSERAASRASEDIEAQGWPLAGAARVPVELGRDDCIAGWLDGAVDRFRRRYWWVRREDHSQIFVSFTTYESEASAQADLGRARSEEYRRCQEQSEPDQVPESTVARSVHLDPDAQLPGVGFKVDVVSRGRWVTGFEHVIVVGRMRAHVDLCPCLHVPFETQREVALAAARAMADVQGLPAPG